MARTHHYTLTLEWTGNRGAGTSGYRDYDRSHSLSAPGKPPIPGSSDTAFLGDARAWNPEQLFLASLSACHQLWFLHLAAEAGVIVTAYRDQPVGEMVETTDGGGQFTSVTLRPDVTVDGGAEAATLAALHARAHQLCFIARSVNFPVACTPVA
jgi:organic hydroperoxide reductase OsmC/OhrA